MKKTSKAAAEGHGAVVKDSLSTFGTNIANAGMGMIASFMIMGVLDPESKGYITLVQTVAGTLMTILSLSVHSSVIYFVSRYGLKNVRKSLWKISTVVVAVVLLVGLASVFVLRDSYFGGTPFLFCILAIAYAMLSFVSTLFTCILRGENQFGKYNLIIMFQQFLTMLCAFSVFIWKTPLVIILSSLLIMVLVSVLCIYAIRKVKIEENEAPEDAEVGVQELIRYSLKSHVSNVLTYLNTYLGNLMVQGFYKTAALGLYSFAFTLMEKVWLLPNAVSQVILSRVSSMTENQDKVRLTVLSCKLVTYATFICAFLLTWFARIFVPILFPKYVGAIPALDILIIGSIFITYAKVLANSIAAYGKPELNILPTVVGVVSNLILGFFLIPRYGIIGAATTTSICLSLHGFTSIIIFCKFTKTPVYRLVIPSKEEIQTVLRVIKK